MSAAVSVLLLCVVTLASLIPTSGHGWGDAPRKYLGKEETRAAIREARIDIQASSPFLGDGESSWSPLDLPTNEFMQLVVTIIEGVDALSNDTSPTPIERLTDILGSLVIFVRNVRMAMDSNGQSSGCNSCMVSSSYIALADHQSAYTYVYIYMHCKYGYFGILQISHNGTYRESRFVIA